MDESLLQSGSGLTNSDVHKRKLSPDDDFITKVATLVTERLSNPLQSARPVNTLWTNYNLSPPSTSVIGSVQTTPPLPFDVKRFKNDDNDSFDEKQLMKCVPPKFKKQASILLKQFDERGDELTWNSDGVIFIDQISIPQSNIYELFPYLFKVKHPKNLQGFEDFIQKIQEMGLSHLIHSASTSLKKPKEKEKVPKLETSKNWWFLD